MMEKNRKARKARWLRFKNAYTRYPNCVYGVAFCDHVYEEQYPWLWVDFRFPSFAHRRRYYSVAAVTLGHLALDNVEARAYDEVNYQLPLDPEEDRRSIVVVGKTAEGDTLYSYQPSAKLKELLAEREELKKRLFNEYAQEPITLRESIEQRLEYGPVAIGLWAHVNRDKLEPSWLNGFAHWYNSMGLPLKQGIIWEGEEVEIVPAEVLKRAGHGE
jgi:hypothetical protein